VTLSGGQRAFFAVAAIAAFLLTFRLGERSFRNPDEGRYAEVALEMVQSGNWIEPTLYGVDYHSKPVFFYWLTALSFTLFGATEAAARSVPALFAFLGVLAAFGFAVRVFGVRSAFLGGLALATNVWYVQVGRYLLIDAVFSCFVSVSLFSFYMAVRENKKVYYYAGYAMAALSFLTKGVAGPVLVGSAFLVYLAVSRRSAAGVWRAVLRSNVPAGSLLFLVIVLPWFVSISMREPEFLRQFFLYEHLQRFTSQKFEHQEPWYYYGVIMAAVLMPWTLFPSRIARPVSGDAARDDGRLFLLVAALTPVFFYSLSKTKLATYMLPSLPFCALLVGEGWANIREGSFLTRRLSFTLAAVFCLAAALVAATPEITASFLRKAQPSILPTVRAFAAIGAAGMAAALYFMSRRRPSAVFGSLVVTLAAVSLTTVFAMERANVDFTTRPFAEALSGRLESGDAVFIYDQPGAFYDFRFYLKHPVKLAGLEGELKLAENDGETARFTVSIGDFKQMLRADTGLYCLIRRSDFEGLEPDVRARLRVLKEDRRKVLFVSGAPSGAPR